MSTQLNKNETRMLTGFIIGVVVLSMLYLGGIFLFLLVAACVYLGSKEYVEILKHKGFFPSLKVILIMDLILAILFYTNNASLILTAITITTITSFMWVLFKGRQPYIANVATTILGFVYCGWFPLHLLFLRDIGSDAAVFNGIIKTNPSLEGAAYAILLLISIILTDSCCYYAGLQFGKHKLAEVISPNKTIEGAIGGSVACMIFCSAFGIMVFNLPWYHALILSILITAFAQIGDLCESMIKRDAGVKDSSDIIPGHGGFLDRTDSYILTIPVVYYYLEFFVKNNFLDLLKGLF